MTGPLGALQTACRCKTIAPWWSTWALGALQASHHGGWPRFERSEEVASHHKLRRRMSPYKTQKDNNHKSIINLHCQIYSFTKSKGRL